MRLSIAFCSDDMIGEYDLALLNEQMTAVIEDESSIKIKLPFNHLNSSALVTIFHMHFPRLISACKRFKLEFNLTKDEDLHHFIQVPQLISYIYQHFQTAEHLTHLHYILKTNNQLNHHLIFENFVSACQSLPNKSLIQELLISAKGLELSQSMNNLSNELCQDFFNFVAALGHLRCFSFHSHDVPFLFQDRLHHLIEQMPELYMLELKYHDSQFDLYSFANVLKNQSLQLLYLECTGVWQNMPVHRSVAQSWQAVQQALRSNHILQRLTFNLYNVFEPSYVGITSIGPQSYFSSHFLETLKIIGQMPHLDVLQICMPRFIGNDLVDINKQIPLFGCFEHIKHIKFVNLDCLFTPLGGMLQRLSQRLNQKHLSYKPEIRKFIRLLSPLRQKTILDNNISDFYHIKALDVLRLDMELCQYVAPLIANTEPPQLEGDKVLVQRFSSDLMTHTFPRQKKYFEGKEHLGLNILKFLDAKTMACMVLASGGIHAHLKRQIFDKFHKVPAVLENGPHSSTRFFLSNGRINLRHDYSAQEVQSILTSRMAKMTGVKVLPALNFDGPMIENYLSSVLLPSLSSKEILVLPIYTPGHWLGLVIDLRTNNDSKVYCFDSLPKKERTNAVILKLLPCLPQQFSVFLHQHGLIVDNPYDSGCFLIENIMSLLDPLRPSPFITYDMRLSHGLSLIKNPLCGDNSSMNISAKTHQLGQVSPARFLPSTKLINLDGTVNKLHHYTASDMKVILTHRLNYFPTAKILHPLNFEASGFAYALHHVLLASQQTKQQLVLPIETYSHWIGIVIERKNSRQVIITLHDSLPNRKRAHIIIEKVLPLVKKAWNVDVEWQLAIRDCVQTDVHSCGAFLIENIVNGLDPAATIAQADALNIRQSHILLIQREQPGYLSQPQIESGAAPKRMCLDKA